MEKLPPETLRAILSYCDLRSLVTVRRVSKQFRAWSDEVPKRWINVSDLIDHQQTRVRRIERIKGFARYAGSDLLGFTGFKDAADDGKYLGALPRILSENCPNLKILHLPNVDGLSSPGNNVFKRGQYFPCLEEIAVNRIPCSVVLALPALKRIHGTVVEMTWTGQPRFGMSEARVIILKLSECQFIRSINYSLIRSLAVHFYNIDLDCSPIRVFCGVIDLPPNLFSPWNPEESVFKLVDAISRLFPEAWYSVDLPSAENAKRVVPIAGRIKRVRLSLPVRGWNYEEQAPVLSSMEFLEELHIVDDYGPGEYSQFFSFLSNFLHLEHLQFNSFRGSGLAEIIGMLPAFAPLKILRIIDSYDDKRILSEVLSRRRFPLKSLVLWDHGSANAWAMTRSVLEPIMEASPGIAQLSLKPCTDEVVMLVPQRLDRLSSFHCEPCSAELALKLAEERVASGRVAPGLRVRFGDGVGFKYDSFLENRKRFGKAGIKLDWGDDGRSYAFEI